MKDKFLHFLEKGIALVGLCLFFLYFSGGVSFAASKPINSIHIQIYSKLAPDTLTLLLLKFAANTLLSLVPKSTSTLTF